MNHKKLNQALTLLKEVDQELCDVINTGKYTKEQARISNKLYFIVSETEILLKCEADSCTNTGEQEYKGEWYCDGHYTAILEVEANN